MSTIEIIVESPSQRNPRLFRYCPNTPDSVIVHRLVSTAWKESSISHWKALTPIKVVQNPQCGSLDQETTPIHQFLDDVQIIAERFTHQNFELKWWNMDEDNLKDTMQDEHASLNKRFWNTCGANMKILTLSQCILPFTFSLIPPTFWRAMPNLECLSLLNCDMQRLTTSDEVPKDSAVFSFSFKEICPGGEVDEQVVEQIYYRVEKVMGSPAKLKFLQIHNLTCRERYIPLHWCHMRRIFRNLERILVSQQVFPKFEKPNNTPCIEQQLMELDVMNIARPLDKLANATILFMPTKKMSFNCGFGTTREQICSVLEFQAAHLEVLTMYRAPFEVAYPGFPCDVALDSLTKLELWGNVSTNLNFFNRTPCLKNLSWNVSCYDEETHGSRLHTMIGYEMPVLLVDNIINKNTDALGDIFKLKSLETLEFESGLVSLNSIRKLGKWLPNLKTFKATVVGNLELVEIARQWPNLEHLELTHGSIISANALLRIYYTEKLFTNLKSFVWKACSCNVRIWGMREQCAEKELRKTCGNNVVHPWIRAPLRGGELRRGGTKCLQALFEQALDGQRESQLAFLEAVDNFAGVVQ